MKVPLSQPEQDTTLHMKWLGHTISQKDDRSDISTRLQEGTLCIGCDGSVNKGRSSYGYILQSNCEENDMQGMGSFPPTVNKPSSLRAELFRALAVMVSVAQLSQNIIPNKKTSYKAVCDNKEVIYRLNRTTPRTSRKDLLCPEFDITQAIDSIKTSLTFKGVWQWVKSHQENNVRNESLLNTKPDALANKGHLTNTYKLHEDYNTPTLWGKSRQITSDISSAITKCQSKTKIKNYYQKKYNWSYEMYRLIDWHAFGVASKSSSFSLTRFSRKLISGWLPIGQKIYNQTEQTTMCPIFKIEPETLQHTLKCASLKCDNHWKNINTQLKAINTAPPIRTFWKNFFEGKPVENSPQSDNPNDLQCLMIQKTDIGYTSLAQGFLLCGWEDANIYLIDKFPECSSSPNERWSSQAIHILWKHCFRLWEYRNRCLHNTADKTCITRQFLLDKITNAYTQGKMSVHKHDHFLFHKPLHERREESLQSLTLWLREFKLA